jgi:hypothetical protein
MNAFMIVAMHVMTIIAFAPIQDDPDHARPPTQMPISILKQQHYNNRDRLSDRPPTRASNLYGQIFF